MNEMNANTGQLVTDWIGSSPSAAKENDLLNNNLLIETIFQILEDLKSDEQFLEPICTKLYSYYRSDDEELRQFCLSFIPTLIIQHIRAHNNCSFSDKFSYQSIDVLLLGIYNLEVVDTDGQLINRTFRMASLSKPSIYHEPSQHSSTQTQQSLLTEHALSKLETSSVDINIPLFGPYLEVEQIVANNRMDVMTVLMKVYNQYISHLSKYSLNSFCKMCLRLLRQGSVNIIEKRFTQTNLNNLDINEMITRNSTRVSLSSQFLVEITNSIYFCMFNGLTDLGFEVLEEIHKKAVYLLYTDVLLMTNAIRNSILINSGQPSDGPMGINVALSPTSTTSTTTAGISKIAITNASFKTRKLPDDIPIVITQNSQTNIGLTSINEENEELGDKSIKATVKGVTAGIGKMGLQLLKERKEKKKDSKDTNLGPKVKYRAENGDLINNKLITQEDSGNENGSDTSVSDSKMSYSEETIPLTVFNQSINYFDVTDDNVSSNSGESVKVPLVSNNDTNIVQHSLNKHNNETTVNV